MIWAVTGRTRPAAVGGPAGGGFGGLPRPDFWLPLADAGAGVVSMVPAIAGSPTPAFARAGTAMTTLQNGLLGSVASGVPRSYYEPSSFVTNYNRQSQDFSHADWAKTGSTVTADAAIAPDGTMTADKVSEDGLVSFHAVSQSVLVASPSVVFTVSVYLKAADYTTAVISMSGGVPIWGAGSNPKVDVDLANGIITATTGGISTSGTIAHIRNGWYRVSLTSTTDPAAVGTPSFQIFPRDDLNQASVAGLGIYVWGAQGELASSMGAYVPTTTTSLTVCQTYIGYLPEPIRTNLVQWSQSLNTAPWVATDTVVTPDAIVAPDGTTTADLLTEGVAGTAILSQAVTATADANYSISRYLKYGNCRWMRILTANGANAVSVWFDIQNGVVGSSAASGTSLFVSAKIERLPNGWFRCSVVVSVGSGATSIATATLSASGDGLARVNNATRYEWGAQFENNVLYTTSYIPTVGATVTRPGDAMTFPIAGNTTKTQGACSAEVYLLSATGINTGQHAVDIDDANGRALSLSGTDFPDRILAFDGTNTVTKASLTSMATAPRKRASSWGPAGLFVTGDGQPPVAAGAYTGTMGSGSTTNIGIGCNPAGGGVSQLGGGLKNVKLWVTQPTDAQLQAMSI